MKITIECNEEQADLMVAALEDYFRLRMGQNLHMAQSLADDTYKFDANNPDNECDFQEYIERRECLEHLYRQLITASYGRTYGGGGSSDACRNASDIWRCLRHELYMTSECKKNGWDVRGDKPIQLGTIDLPKIEVER